MKIRVKLVEYAGGKKEYFAQYRWFFIWRNTTLTGYTNAAQASYDAKKFREEAYNRKVAKTSIVGEV